MTTVFPAASAGISFMPTDTTGPFQVRMMPDDAIRLGHRVGELTLVGREGRDPPFDLVGPARVVRTSNSP